MDIKSKAQLDEILADRWATRESYLRAWELYAKGQDAELEAFLFFLETGIVPVIEEEEDFEDNDFDDGPDFAGDLAGDEWKLEADADD